MIRDEFTVSCFQNLSHRLDCAWTKQSKIWLNTSGYLLKEDWTGYCSFLNKGNSIGKKPKNMSSGKVFMINYIHNGTLKKKKKVKIPVLPCNVFYSK